MGCRERAGVTHRGGGVRDGGQRHPFLRGISIMSSSSTFRFIFGLSTSLFVAAFASISVAQAPQDYSNTPPGPFHQPVAPYPVEFGFSQDHSSTAAEGFLRGTAAVIQARGNFEL